VVDFLIEHDDRLAVIITAMLHVRGHFGLENSALDDVLWKGANASCLSRILSPK
jgi:hypothetical protein